MYAFSNCKSNRLKKTTWKILSFWQVRCKRSVKTTNLTRYIFGNLPIIVSRLTTWNSPRATNPIISPCLPTDEFELILSAISIHLASRSSERNRGATLEDDVRGTPLFPRPLPKNIPGPSQETDYFFAEAAHAFRTCLSISLLVRRWRRWREHEPWLRVCCLTIIIKNDDGLQVSSRWIRCPFASIRIRIVPNFPDKGRSPSSRVTTSTNFGG